MLEQLDNKINNLISILILSLFDVLDIFYRFVLGESLIDDVDGSECDHLE